MMMANTHASTSVVRVKMHQDIIPCNCCIFCYHRFGINAYLCLQKSSVFTSTCL